MTRGGDADAGYYGNRGPLRTPLRGTLLALLGGLLIQAAVAQAPVTPPPAAPLPRGGGTPVTPPPAAPPPIPAPPPTPRMPELSLTLGEAVRLATLHNLDVQIAAREPAVRGAEVTIARGAFDPILAHQISRAGYAQGFPNSDGSIAVGDTGENSAYIQFRQRTPLGPSYSVDYQYLGQRTTFGPNDPAFYSNRGDTTLNVSVPLLRGAGPEVNLADVHIALQAQQIGVLNYQVQALDSGAAVERAWWILVRSRWLLEVRRDSRDRARRFVEQLDEGVREGVLAPFETYEAAQNVATREADVAQAELDLELANQALLRLLGRKIMGENVIPAEVPKFEPKHPAADGLVEEALRHRPEVERAERSLEALRIQGVVEDNALLPQLNLMGQYKLSSLRESLYNWRVGLDMEFPLGNRRAEGGYERNRLLQEQARLQLDNVRQGVILDVAQAARAVYNSADRVAAAERARRSAEQRVEAEMARFKAGLTTSHLVVYAERLLLDARELQLSALAEYHLAEVGLDRARGLTLDKYHIVVQQVPAQGGRESLDRSRKTGP